MAENPEVPKPETAPPLPLSSEESADIDRAIAWLQKHWDSRGQDKCQICSGDDWQVGGPIALPAYRRTLGAAVVPAFTLTCSTCGNMLLLNALFPTYLLADDPEAKPEEEGK